MDQIAPVAGSDAGSATVAIWPLPAASYTVSVAPWMVGSPLLPAAGSTMRCAAGSRPVDALKATRRAEEVPGSVSLNAVVSIVTYGRVVVVTLGPPHPVGSFVSSMPSGRTPKSGSGQPDSSAPRS